MRARSSPRSRQSNPHQVRSSPAQHSTSHEIPPAPAHVPQCDSNEAHQRLHVCARQSCMSMYVAKCVICAFGQPLCSTGLQVLGRPDGDLKCVYATRSHLLYVAEVYVYTHTCMKRQDKTDSSSGLAQQLLVRVVCRSEP